MRKVPWHLLLVAFALGCSAVSLFGQQPGEPYPLPIVGPEFNMSVSIQENVSALQAWQEQTLNPDNLSISSPEKDVATLAWGDSDLTLRLKLVDGVYTLVWDGIQLNFLSDVPGTHVVTFWEQRDQYRVDLPDSPDPPPPTEAPWESPGLTVMILRESKTQSALPATQRVIFTSPDLHNWLTTNTVKLPDNNPGYRIADDDLTDLSNVPPVLRNAYAAIKARMTPDVPTIGISNGKTGIIAPLPSDVEQTIALLEKYK